MPTPTGPGRGLIKRRGPVDLPCLGPWTAGTIGSNTASGPGTWAALNVRRSASGVWPGKAMAACSVRAVGPCRAVRARVFASSCGRRWFSVPGQWTVTSPTTSQPPTVASFAASSIPGALPRVVSTIATPTGSRPSPLRPGVLGRCGSPRLPCAMRTDLSRCRRRRVRRCRPLSAGPRRAGTCSSTGAGRWADWPSRGWPNRGAPWRGAYDDVRRCLHIRRVQAVSGFGDDLFHQVEAAGEPGQGLTVPEVQCVDVGLRGVVELPVPDVGDRLVPRGSTV